MRYYSKLGGSKLINPPEESFQITDVLNNIGIFEFQIQNNSGNRSILSSISDDLEIRRVSDDALLFSGKIDHDSIRYLSRNRINLSGHASFIELGDTLFKRLADADASAAETVDEAFGTLGGKFNIGQDETFLVIKIPYTVAGVQNTGTTVVIEYSKGAGVWATLDCLDESRAFTKVANVDYYLITPNKPSDWAKDTISTKTKYWVRFRITAGSYSTNPTFGSIYTGSSDILRVQYDNIPADTILTSVLTDSGYFKDATDQCPSDLISMRGEYESRLRWVAAIAKALTWTDGGDKKSYDWWVTPDKKVHFKQQRGKIPITSMIEQDYTTFTEVDPNSHLALVGTNHLDFDSYCNEDCYLYKDCGVNFFDAFTHKVDVKATGLDKNFDTANFWCLSNDVDDVFGWYSDGKSYLGLRIFRSWDGTKNIQLQEGYGIMTYSSAYTGLLEDTWYYLTVSKSGTSLTCKIYSNSARTTLLTTLSLTLHANHKFRYLFGCNTLNNGNANTCTLDIENLEISTNDISPILTMLDNLESYQGIANLVHGLGAFDGVNQRRAIVENQASQDSYGIRELYRKDLRYSHETSLKELIEKELTNSRLPLKEVSCTLATKFWLDHSLEVGDEIAIDQPSWNVSAQTFRIQRAVIGPSRTTLDLGIQQTHLENIRSALQRQVDIADVWMHGAGNIYSVQSYENCDVAHPLHLRFFLPPEVKYLNRVLLNFKIKQYRAYTGTTPSGGGSTTPSGGGSTTPSGGGSTSGSSSKVTSDAAAQQSSTATAANYITGFIITATNPQNYAKYDHKHKILTPYYGDYMAILGVRSRNVSRIYLGTDWADVGADGHFWTEVGGDYQYVYGHLPTSLSPAVDITKKEHTHLVDMPGHNMEHTHTTPAHTHTTPNHTHATPDHTHAMTYAIYEASETSPSITVKVGEDGGSLTEIKDSPFTTGKTKLDITDLVRTVGMDKWIDVEFTPNQIRRIEANAYIQVFIESK